MKKIVIILTTLSALAGCEKEPEHCVCVEKGTVTERLDDEINHQAPFENFHSANCKDDGFVIQNEIIFTGPDGKILYRTVEGEVFCF